MNDTPKGWPRISPSLVYDKPAEAIDWICRAFGFEVRIKVEGDDGMIHHSELTFGGGVIMVSGNAQNSQRPEATWRKHPREVGGGNTQSLMVYVDDVEAHCKRAREAGAVIVNELTTSDYGEEYWSDRSYQCEDVGGHHWYFCQRLRSPKSS